MVDPISIKDSDSCPNLASDFDFREAFDMVDHT